MDVGEVENGSGGWGRVKLRVPRSMFWGPDLKNPITLAFQSGLIRLV